MDGYCGFVVGDDLFFAVTALLENRASTRESWNLCRVHAHTVRIGDLEVDAVESADSAAALICTPGITQVTSPKSEEPVLQPL